MTSARRPGPRTANRTTLRLALARRILRPAIGRGVSMAAAMLLAGSSHARAQAATGPVFTLQPGMLISDFVSSGRASSTGFNLRFDTRFPTRLRWFTPVIGASVLPYGTSAPGGRNLNTTTLFVGNVFPLIRATPDRGWFTIELPVLLYHAYHGGTASDPRVYRRDLFIQVATYLHVGRRILHEFGPSWHRLDLFAFVEQNVTPDEDAAGRVDRFNPTAMFGLSLSFGSRGSP
ncbi:MAG TPA: hypothetical protein VF178_11640 [Gemmatimonadaceae bacterium]